MLWLCSLQWRPQPSIYCPLALRIGAPLTANGSSTTAGTNIAAPFIWDIHGNQKHPLRALTVTLPATLSSTVWELVSVSFDSLIDKLTTAAAAASASASASSAATTTTSTTTPISSPTLTPISSSS
jgi:hypothetical protein